MVSSTDDRLTPVSTEAEAGPGQPGADGGAGDWTLRRWLVSIRSGGGRYEVGECVALTAPDAAERAIAVVGPGEDPRAEEIPWDAAPLPRLNPPAPRGTR